MLKKPVLTLAVLSGSMLGLLMYRPLINAEWASNLGVYYRSSIISPLEYTALIILLISLYLLLFNLTIQQSWWRWARFALIVPFALIILLLPMYQGGGGFISFGGTTELVILWGVIFAAATLIHTLYQQFYLKTGVIRNN